MIEQEFGQIKIAVDDRGSHRWHFVCESKNIDVCPGSYQFASGVEVTFARRKVKSAHTAEPWSVLMTAIRVDAVSFVARIPRLQHLRNRIEICAAPGKQLDGR